MFGGGDSMEMLVATACGRDAFAGGPGRRPGLGSAVATAVRGRIGQADDEAASPVEDSCRVWMAHPAPVFAQGDVQAVTKPALDRSGGTFPCFTDKKTGKESFPVLRARCPAEGHRAWNPKHYFALRKNCIPVVAGTV